MALDYLGHPVDYDQLLTLLDVGPFGTPAGRVRRLTQWGITVEYGEGETAMLEALVDAGWPVIVLVRTQELPYWQGFDTYHSVVVVGYNATHVYVNDPHFDNAPIQVTRGDFWLAWLGMNNRYAFISLP
jgi:predicted double-glycine peptidase